MFEALEERRLLSSVVAAHLFYNDSFFDGYHSGIDSAVNEAIAVDKSPLRELEQATFANYSS